MNTDLLVSVLKRASQRGATAADARPAKTRSDSRCSREWLMFSISRIRTEALNRLSSTR